MSNYQPIAQIFCRYTAKPPRGYFRPGKDFFHNQEKRETHSTVESHAYLDVYLFSGQLIRVGRHIKHNEITVLHPYISRQHFVIYSIEYEEDGQPLLYVRDDNSLSGTYVDGPCRRLRRVSPSGYLLSQGEIIRIKPYWEFHIYLLGRQPIGSIIGQLRPSETDLFQTRFLITEKMLGSGALAAVHLAINIKSGRQVACKIHQLDRIRRLHGSSSTIRRILDETNILSRLTHPNLLKFVAAYRSLDTLYTFTELAMGGDLFSMRLKHPDGIPEMDAQIIIRQIIEAISYLHAQNIAHRDLKPENIFLATGPNIRARVIVGDLGFAKVATSGRMTSTIGTQRFTAPEVYHGQCYGTEVDIWSIGMIALFLVALNWNSLGCFDALDQNAVDASLIAVFDNISKRRKALSEHFRDFIRLCLSVAPSNRITADASKGHPWFHLSGSKPIENYTVGWKPSRVAHNSVEDLDLFESTGTQNTLSTASMGKRKAQYELDVVKDTQFSHYFANDDWTRHKRQKAAPAQPVIKLTGIYGEEIDLKI
ncbi:kinase-like domain-containing protein [Xylaria sp. FL1777]|nr:kinase-like domain-containing protein [Xylaria sp. FL1777]